MALPTPIQTDVLIWAIMIHLVADWLLQNEWMATNKRNLRHPAGWVHGGIHALGFLLIFPWYLALLVGISHVLIDTRKPVNWWMTVIKGMRRESPMYAEVAIWLDQIFHVLVLGVIVLLFFR